VYYYICSTDKRSQVIIMYIKSNSIIRSFLVVSFLFVTFKSFTQTVAVEDVKNHVGEKVTILGKIADGRYLGSVAKKPTLLNINKAYPNQPLTVIIYGDNRNAFGYKPEEALLNKNVFVTGKVSLYNGKPQIEVERPDQIVIASSGTAGVNAVDAAKTIAQGDIQVKSAVKLRSGPGNNYKTIAKLKAGSVLQVLHSDNGWSYVSVKRALGTEDKNYTLVGFIKSGELK
jgi:DNA/RNA endonuclease YhcR with UshA esterase domain